MSESSGLTNRYAKALLELAAEKKLVSKIVKDFQEIIKSGKLKLLSFMKSK